MKIIHIYSIIGTPFYLMEYVEGKIHKDPSLPGMTPEERKKVYSAMNRTIAKIHAVDVHQAGVADYGKHGNDDNDTFWIMFVLFRWICWQTDQDLVQAV